MHPIRIALGLLATVAPLAAGPPAAASGSLAAAPSPAADPASRADSLAVAGAADSAGRTAATPADSAAAPPFVLVDAGSLPLAPGGPDGLGQPAGVACDAFGRITASDARGHRLQRYRADGAWEGAAGGLGSGEGELRRPGAVAALGTLHLAVLDRQNRRVVAYDLQGRHQATRLRFDDPAFADLGRIDAVDLAADRGGSLYLLDADRERILVFDFAGTLVREIDGAGGALAEPRGLAVDRRGQLLVAAGSRLQRLDAGGRLLASRPLPWSAGRGALPVAADDSGRVAVGDAVRGELAVLDESGAALARLSGLAAPAALAFHRDGSLLVAESGAGRVRRLRLVRAADAGSAPAEPATGARPGRAP